MRNQTRVWLVSGALMAGAVVGGAGIASAATSGSSGSATPPAYGAAGTGTSDNGTRPDPAKVSHGPGETLLTGTTADKVKSAALAAVPGATVIRVETDSAGSPYEAHLTKSDGTQVTVKVDSSFKVSKIENGFGGPPK